MSKYRKKHIPWNKGKKGLQKNPKFTELNKSRKGISRTERVKRKISETKTGEPNPAVQGSKNRHWKGGINPINNTIRKSREYKLWRIAVFERDNYTCVWCGARSGKDRKVYLEAHHIKPFADYPELRFAIDNGRTLCRECHKKTSTYGCNLFS